MKFPVILPILALLAIAPPIPVVLRAYNASGLGGSSASDKATAELPIKLPLILKLVSEYSTSEPSEALAGVRLVLKIAPPAALYESSALLSIKFPEISEIFPLL